MKKLTFFFLMFIGLAAAQAHDMEAMKYYNLGLASTLTSKKIAYFTEALRLNPALVEAYEKRGLLYYFQEKYDAVIQDFQKYIELAPGKAEDFRMLGLGFLRSRIYNQAIDNFTRAIKLKPNCADSYADRAEAYRLISRYNDAIRDSTKAIEIWADPGTMSDAYRTRAKSYLAIGRNTEAFTDNYKVTSLDPSTRMWGKSKPISAIGAMSLLILNGAVFFFLFELKPNLLKIGRYRRLNILSSKLLAPQAADTVTRERLHLLFAEIPQKRLTTVIAGAGYGKTTFIAQAHNYLNLNTVWYRLEPSDGDFIIFLSYLTAGIQKHFPGFGAETCRWLVKKQNLKQSREAVLTVFLKELENVVKKDLMIVLDDYHTIQYSREIKSALDFLITHFPPEVHLIFISRFDVNLPLSRLRAARKTVDVREGDLAFTTGEINRLYSQLFYIFLKQESLEILRRKTEGWVSGLILFYHALKGKGPAEIEKLLLTLKGSQKLIFSYLEENVYNLLTDEKKEFLIKTSILPRVNAEFCDQLLQIHHSRDILKDLEENHLFTSSFDDADKWYTYHQLFRDFLQTKLITELGCQAVLELYKQAAGLLENFDEDEEAISDDLNEASFLKVWRRLNKNETKTVGSLKLLPNLNHHKINDAPVDHQSAIPKLQTLCLKVYLFGKFRVFQGDQEIYDKRWKSKKAQMIFKYLLYHRQKGYLKKDVLMELLWPEDDPVKTAKRFHVALASMRKTLEPEITRGTPSAYILRSGSAYHIDIGDEGYVDIDNFKKELKLAQKSKDSEESTDHLLKAEAIYRGDFLEEDLYVQWCDEERERFKEEYLQLLEEITKYYHVKKDYKKCIYYANKYLKTDIYAESIYQLLMIYYSRIGNNAMVNKIFKKCKDNIIKGLDCPVSKETEKLYHELTSDSGSTSGP
jgi:DNA-binding SARP family transcriptional activator/tetratricopeptide (TPR) repeat protein